MEKHVGHNQEFCQRAVPTQIAAVEWQKNPQQQNKQTNKRHKILHSRQVKEFSFFPATPQLSYSQVIVNPEGSYLLSTSCGIIVSCHTRSGLALHSYRAESSTRKASTPPTLGCHVYPEKTRRRSSPWPLTTEPIALLAHTRGSRAPSIVSSLYPCTQTRVRYIGPLRDKQPRRGSKQSIFPWGLCVERSRRPDTQWYESPKTVMGTLSLPRARVGVLVATFCPLKRAQYKSLLRKSQPCYQGQKCNPTYQARSSFSLSRHCLSYSATA